MRMAALQVAAGVDAVLDHDVIYSDGLCKVYFSRFGRPAYAGSGEILFF